MENFDLNEFVPKNFISAEDILKNKLNDITLEDIKKVHKKAYLESLQCFYKTAYLREHVRRFAEDGSLPYTPDDPSLREMLHNQANTLISKPPYMLLTINPKTDDLESLQKSVKKFIKKKTIKHYLYCYEVRKQNAGLHCHILLEYDDKPYNFKRGTKNTFKNICDVNNPHILNFKFIELDHIQSKIDYLKGDKKESKQEGVKATILYRTEKDLLPIYESNPPFPCRVAVENLE